MDAYITNATGEGTSVDTWPHYAMPLPWSDPTSGLDGYGTGGNLTMSMPQVGLNILPLNNGNRLNFTLSNTDTGGEDISLIFDDQALDGEYPIPRSSFLQLPQPAEPLPVYFNLIQSQKVAYFAYNTGDEGAWFTYQGTRIVFNATDTTGHYTGIVDSVWNGVDDLVHLSATQDGPFIDKDATADIVFWQPQKAPQAAIPDPADYIPVGTYDVTVYVNGYDEDGTVFVQSLDIGTILVIAP
jgi:hypothetical protein